MGMREMGVWVGGGVLALAACAPSQAAPQAALPPMGRQSASSRAIAPCTTAQLGLGRGAADGGLSHAGGLLIFTNKGAPCGISGYPTIVRYAQDKIIDRVQQTLGGYLGGSPENGRIPVIHLDTGETASALVEGVASGVMAPPCPTEDSVLITPPNNTQPIHSGPINGDYSCSLEVHPLIATGRASVPR